MNTNEGEKMSEQVQVEISVSDFNTAGLEEEGIYRLRVKTLQVVERTVQSGDRAGEQYKTIAGQFELVELFGVDIIEEPPTQFINFAISGRGLERFRKYYVAAFGKVEEGDAGQTVTLNDLAAALVGNDSVWTTYSWKRSKRDPDEIEGNLGWSFSQDPSTLKAPRPFAERDAA